MIETIGWPAWAMPNRSMIGALAAIVLATALVLAPIPLVNNASEASAHEQRRCFTETVLVGGTGGWFRGRGGVRVYVPARYEERTTCVNEAHSHPGRDLLVGAAVAVGCGTFAAAVGGATGPVGGFIAGSACTMTFVGASAGATASNSSSK